MTTLHTTPVGRRTIAMLFAATLSLASTALAAPGMATPAAIASLATARPSDDSAAPPSQLFDLDFPGGSLSDYVAKLRLVAPLANIVVEGDPNDVVLAPIRLRQVDLRSAVQVLAHHQSPKAVIQFAEVEGTGLDNGELSAPVTIMKVRSNAATAPSGTSVESLRSAIELSGVSAAQVLEAIEVAVRSTGAADRTTIAFHEPTSLLMISGPPAATDAMKQVLAALVAKPAADQRSGAWEQAKAQLQQALGSAQSSLAAKVAEAERLRDELHRREARMSELESVHLERAVMLRTVEVELDMTRKQLAECSALRAELEQQLAPLRRQPAERGGAAPARGGS